MFFCEDGEIVLTDYKTNRNTTAEKLIHDYKGQLSVYKRAIEEMTGLKVKECWIYSFEKGAVLIHGI
jgi:ATP-dependent helicase/nuclease subunit A